MMEVIGQGKLTVVLHCPQLDGSVAKLTHLPLQQFSTARQAEPGQPPQWSGFEVGSIQVPRQQVLCGAVHYVSLVNRIPSISW